MVPGRITHRHLGEPAVLDAHLVDLEKLVHLLDVPFLLELERGASLLSERNGLDGVDRGLDRHLGGASFSGLVGNGGLLLAEHPEGLLVRGVQQRRILLVPTAHLVLVFAVPFAHLLEQKVACRGHLSQVSARFGRLGFDRGLELLVFVGGRHAHWLHELGGVGEFVFVLEGVVRGRDSDLLGAHELGFLVGSGGRLVLLQHDTRESFGQRDLSRLRFGLRHVIGLKMKKHI